MTADHKAQRQAADSQATDQGAVQAVRRGLSRLFETSQSGADQIILSALAEAGYTVVKTERLIINTPPTDVDYGRVLRACDHAMTTFGGTHCLSCGVPVPEGSAEEAGGE